jgi:hypothetical protein
MQGLPPERVLRVVQEGLSNACAGIGQRSGLRAKLGHGEGRIRRAEKTHSRHISAGGYIMDYHVNKMAGFELNPRVRARINAAHMTSGKNVYQFIDSLGFLGIVKAYHNELLECEDKLSDLALDTLGVLQRMDSGECRGVMQPELDMLSERLETACGILGVDSGQSREALERDLYSRVSLPR